MSQPNSSSSGQDGTPSMWEIQDEPFVPDRNIIHLIPNSDTWCTNEYNNDNGCFVTSKDQCLSLCAQEPDCTYAVVQNSTTASQNCYQYDPTNTWNIGPCCKLYNSTGPTYYDQNKPDTTNAIGDGLVLGFG